MTVFPPRQATIVDAPEIVRLHTDVHEEAYGALLPDEFFRMRGATLEQRIAQRRVSLAEGSLPLLAQDGDGTLIGIAHAGPAQDEYAPTALELYMIYALARVHGQGVGQALLDAAIGRQPASLWVLEDNPRAHAFYARNGFAPDGRRELLPDAWANLPKIRMVRR
ncbi:MAG: GNAT family N-acetyltransferase [Actinomycetota bacterium]|nr:GNAT family N-acetyltransferase [Actinomycetota bacterium]